MDSLKKLFTLISVLCACQQVVSAQQAVLSAATSSGPARDAMRLTAEQKSWLALARRHEKHGWVYLHIEGPPRQRGFQHGYLLAAEIREGLRTDRIVWEYHSGMDWNWLVDKSKTVLARVDAENLAEIDGIVEGLRAAGVSSSRQEMIAFNGACELHGYWWPKEKEKLEGDAKTPPRQKCSAFVATGRMTKDGGVVLGHNTMDGYYDGDCNVILDIQPDKGHRILMQATPGWIHSGTDFFITDAGLVGSETTIGLFKGFDEKGIPEFARMRRAMQDAGSIDGWCEIMKKDNNGGYANAWLLGDINTKHIALFELGLKYSHFEEKSDGYFYRLERGGGRETPPPGNQRAGDRYPPLVRGPAGALEAAYGQVRGPDRPRAGEGPARPTTSTPICRKRSRRPLDLRALRSGREGPGRGPSLRAGRDVGRQGRGHGPGPQDVVCGPLGLGLRAAV